MKKLRTLICLLLVVLMVLAMGACGSKKSNDAEISKAAVPGKEGSGYKYDSVTIGCSIMPARRPLRTTVPAALYLMRFSKWIP